MTLTNVRLLNLANIAITLLAMDRLGTWTENIYDKTNILKTDLKYNTGHFRLLRFKS